MTYNQDSKWESKYIVQKADGTPVDPKAIYIVLRLDTDHHARIAALAWADSIQGEAPQLAEEVRKTVRECFINHNWKALDTDEEV